MASAQGKPTPVKGILKKTNKTPTSTTTSSTTGATAAATKKPDPREIAIKHAQIIHDRRALEDTVTDSIILLSKLPDIQSATTSTSEPASTSSSSPPSASENTTAAEAAAALFKSHIRLFQPSDYDALIEERNAQGRCGYALCSNPRRRLPPGTGAFKILNFGRSDFAIVPRAEAERWCAGGGGGSSKGKGDGKGKGSSGGGGTVTCARRAMYVRVQLLETAAWERAGIESIAIELLEEVEAERQHQQQQNNSNPINEDEDEARQERRRRQQQQQQDRERKDEAERLQKAARDARDLAMERGDATPTTPKAPPGKKGQQKQRNIKVAIREKTVVVGPVREPTLDAATGPDQHLLLDGYKTKFDPKSESMSKGTTITTTRKDDLAADADADAADVDTTPAAAASTSATTSVEDKSTTAE